MNQVALGPPTDSITCSRQPIMARAPCGRLVRLPILGDAGVQLRCLCMTALHFFQCPRPRQVQTASLLLVMNQRTGKRYALSQSPGTLSPFLRALLRAGLSIHAADSGSHMSTRVTTHFGAAERMVANQCS